MVDPHLPVFLGDGSYAVNFTISPALNFVTNPGYVNFTNGVACFSPIAMSPPVGDYTITFGSAKATIQSVTIPFTISSGNVLYAVVQNLELISSL